MLSCSRCSNALLPFSPSLLWHSFLMTGNLSSLHVGVSAGDNLLGISIRSVWFLSPRGKHPMAFVSKMSPHEHQQFGNAQSGVLTQKQSEMDLVMGALSSNYYFGVCRCIQGELSIDTSRPKGTKLNAVQLYKLYLAFWGDLFFFSGPCVGTMSRSADPLK